MHLPAIIYDLPNEQYHRGDIYKDFISSTQLKKYAVSPKYAKYCLENPIEINMEASMKGNVYHSILSSITNTGCMDEFYNEYFVFDPPINHITGCSYGIETKKYRDAYEQAISDNPEKESTSKAEVDLANTMIYELLNNCGSTSESVNQLIQWGKAEISHFCEYEGNKFKFRTDLKTNRKIIDWKTISSANLHEDTICKQIIQFGYGISAAFYQFFEHEITGNWPEFYWVFQQKNPPYDAIIVSAERWAYKLMDDGSIQKGISALRFEEFLSCHIECTKKKEYKGAEIFVQPNYKGRRIMVADVPGYEKSKYRAFYND